MMMMISTCCYISSSATTSSFPHFRTLFSFKRKEEEKKKRRTGALLPSTSILKNSSADILGISTTATVSSSAAAAKKKEQQHHQDSYYPPRGAVGEEDGLKPNSLFGRGNVAALLIFVQTFSFSLLLPSFPPPPPPALAVLFSPDTKVPRTGELALRRAIPANANMKAIQESLEDISYLLRIPQRKPFGTMEADVRKALKIATQGKESILGTIPDDLKDKGSLLYTSLIDGKGGLQSLIEFIKEKDPDKVSVGLASTLDTVADLELLQAPGLSFLLPGQYMKYPRLTGRGTVEFVIEKGDGSTFFPTGGGEPISLATIQVVLDGYSAPLTAGNIAKLVVDGAYDGVKLKCTDQAVFADNELNNSGYSVPLEVMPSGQFEPLYKTKLSIQDGELPVLPLSVYGAVAMAHSENSEEYSSPSQFFFYLYDKRNAGLGGLSFDEGQFSVFGYTTVGRDILPQIKSGDVIRSAKLVQGRERLVLPDMN